MNEQQGRDLMFPLNERPKDDSQYVKHDGKWFPLNAWCIMFSQIGEIDEETGRLFFDEERGERVARTFHHKAKIECTVHFSIRENGDLNKRMSWRIMFWQPNRNTESGGDWTNFARTPACPGSDDSPVALAMALLNCYNEWWTDYLNRLRTEQLKTKGFGIKFSPAPQRSEKVRARIPQELWDKMSPEDRAKHRGYETPNREERGDNNYRPPSRARGNRPAPDQSKRVSEEDVTQDGDEFLADPESLKANPDFDPHAEEKLRAQAEAERLNREAQAVADRKKAEKAKGGGNQAPAAPKPSTSAEKIAAAEEKFAKKMRDAGKSEAEIKDELDARRRKRMHGDLATIQAQGYDAFTSGAGRTPPSDFTGDSVLLDAWLEGYDSAAASMK